MNGGGNSIFLDTNILVYANISGSPFHQMAKDAIQTYQDDGKRLWISRQIIREYLAVVTRTQSFSNPMSPSVASMRIQFFTTHFKLAEENAEVTDKLLTLINQIAIGGKQIHDANIVATMQVHGINTILTHNTSDFARFSHLINVMPLSEFDSC